MIDWRHWHNEPYLVGGLVLLGWLWAMAAGPLRSWFAPGAPFPRRQAWYFYTALVLFYLTVASPLDQIGERFLFSVHMLQHELLMYPVPVLFLLGLTSWMIDVPFDRPGLRGPIDGFLRPLGCGITAAVVFGVWHSSLLYEWALEDKVVHVIEHLCFFAAALLYWWPMLSPSKAFPPVGYGQRMLYIFCFEVAMTPLFAYVTFSPDVLYPTYEFAPRLVPGFGPADDQLLAGTMMKLISMAVSLLAFGISFYRWSRSQRNMPSNSSAAS